MSTQHTAVVYQPKRASLAAFIGTMIEWYDFYIYAMAAALVFGQVFFPNTSSFYGTLASFGTFAVGFFARPLGGIIFGHIGDKIGRKKSLVITLFLMGAATIFIGLLPTYDSIGLWAPVLLVLLRLIQGIAVGGEWGGAVLMAGEHAKDKKNRTFLSSFAQLGSPAGLILATLMFKMVSTLEGNAFVEWGWRVPFLFSFVMLLIGFFIRMSVHESPEFLKAQAARESDDSRTVKQLPLKAVFSQHTGLLMAAIGANVLGIAGFYFTNTFMLAYTTQYLHMERALILDSLLMVSVMQFLITPLSAYIARKVGNGRFLITTSFLSILTPYVMFSLVDMGSLPLITLGVGVAVLCMGAYYAVIAGFVSGLFPTEVRYTGISLAYQVSGAIFGGLTPIVGTILAERFQGEWWPLAILFSAISLVSLLSVLVLNTKYRSAV